MVGAAAVEGQARPGDPGEGRSDARRGANGAAPAFAGNRLRAGAREGKMGGFHFMLELERPPLL